MALELANLKYMGKVISNSVKEYNNLSDEQKENCSFHVAVVRNDNVHEYCDEVFSFPSKRTPEDALDCVEGCCYNEVEYDVVLVMVYNEPNSSGVHFTRLGYVVGFVK